MVWTSANGPKCPVSPEDRGEVALAACPFCGGPAVNVAFEYITCGAAWNRKCPGHQLQCSEAAWNTRALSLSRPHLSTPTSITTEK